MAGLNQSQKKRILVALARLDRTLAEIDARIAQGDVKSLLSELHDDLTPSQVDVIHDCISEARDEIQRTIELLHIPIHVRRTALSWHVETLLTAQSVAISELSPQNLRGYGPLDPEAAELVGRVQESLSHPIARLLEFLRQNHECHEGRDAG